MELWIVGKFIRHYPDEGSVWEFQGVFDSEDRAAATCQDENYFVAPAVLNIPSPHERRLWPGLYYPEAMAKA